MTLVIQRVTTASVSVDGKTVGAIGRGYLLYIGIAKGDTDAAVTAMAEKLRDFRINADAADKMNLDILQAKGEILAVSQFTLCADTSGRRPGFQDAAPPETARRLYGNFCGILRGYGITVAEGIFGARMDVSSVNDGPVTFVLDSK
jgi:D-tyrosyl-tRNA(Tyr) deacylase